MLETDKAYLAGIIDGEGCIGVYKDNTSYKLKVIVTSTTIDWLYDLRKKWGDIGHIYVCPPPTVKHRPKGSWVLYGKTAQGVLVEVLPYLGIKREQAELALIFRVPPKRTEVSTGCFIPVPDTDRVEQISIAAQLVALKREVSVRPDGAARL